MLAVITLSASTMTPDAASPLTPVILQVLLSLGDGELHGYAITASIAARTAGHMQIQPGNLYRSLRTMLDAGLIEESGRRPAADLDDVRRRYYRITAKGRRAAAAEIARLETLVRQARRSRWLKDKA
jgi:DNA-binding PadR family transcriptional regulator